MQYKFLKRTTKDLKFKETKSICQLIGKMDKNEQDIQVNIDKVKKINLLGYKEMVN